MTAMTLSFAVSSVILRTSPGQGNRTLVTGGRASHRAIMSVAARLPLTDAGPPSAVTHDMAHSFDIADALPVKTDKGDESHRLPARHASLGARHEYSEHEYSERERDPRGDGWVVPLGWTDGVGQAGPSHLRLRRT